MQEKENKISQYLNYGNNRVRLKMLVHKEMENHYLLPCDDGFYQLLQVLSHNLSVLVNTLYIQSHSVQENVPFPM